MHAGWWRLTPVAPRLVACVRRGFFPAGDPVTPGIPIPPGRTGHFSTPGTHGSVSGYPADHPPPTCLPLFALILPGPTPPPGAECGLPRSERPNVDPSESLEGMEGMDPSVLPAADGQRAARETPLEITLLTPAGSTPVDGGGSLRWTAPASAGVVPLRLHGPDAQIDLDVLVMRPMKEVENGILNGYRIGPYVDDPDDLPPVGFVEVAPEDEDILVSPHFTLGQFLCRDPGNPRHLVLSEALVLKLEVVLAAADEANIEAGTLHVMSGFRTPAFNRAIGNTTTRSRHLWGEAADVFIDNSGDGMMDDLDGDGRVDDRDADILMGILEKVDAGEVVRCA